ncbi:hypothetical protein ACF0H5_011848 [Mactra antiquata]
MYLFFRIRSDSTMVIPKDPELFAQPKKTKKFLGMEVPHRFVVYDKVQRGIVFVLASASIILLTRLVVDGVHYYKYRKPVKLEKCRILKEMEMAALQAEREASQNEQLQEKLQAEADKVR